ncbi:MAG: hypothetical protein IJ870_06150 [Alphaproteobacteria bacterium]|nr:hypothetical protein [Alphaproteobacteria bacterium]
MDMKKVMQNTIGTFEITTGVALKLAEFGLTAVDTVFCGVLSPFVKESDMKIGRSFLSGIAKKGGQFGEKLKKDGKGRL